MALTSLAFPKYFLGITAQGLAVFLQFEEAGLLPGVRANLDQLPTIKQELEIFISLQTCRSRDKRASHTNLKDSDDSFY